MCDFPTLEAYLPIEFNHQGLNPFHSALRLAPSPNFQIGVVEPEKKVLPILEYFPCWMTWNWGKKRYSSFQ